MLLRRYFDFYPRTSRNDLIDRLHLTETKITEMERYISTITSERDQLSAMHREVTKELNDRTMQYNSKTNNQEHLKENLFKYEKQMNSMEKEIVRLQNSNTSKALDTTNSQDAERRLRNGVARLREDNDRLAENVALCERRESEFKERNDRNTILLSNQQATANDLSIKLKQKSIVMNRLEEEVESLKTLLRSTSLEKTRWENSEKPTYMNNVRELKKDLFECRQDMKKMEIDRDDMSMELRRGKYSKIGVHRVYIAQALVDFLIFYSFSPPFKFVSLSFISLFLF